RRQAERGSAVAPPSTGDGSTGGGQSPDGDAPPDDGPGGGTGPGLATATGAGGHSGEQQGARA
ncbi:MAG: hypothetical protein JWP46_2960, partial [Modestobacter sp.]|nr:hypothetical protein [Modestobacter sp.]